MQRSRRDRPILRFAGSLGAALCVVSAMLWFGLEVSGFTQRESRRALETYEVRLLSDAERLDLQDFLGGGRSRADRPAAPEPVEVPRARSDARGFVRLDVSIDADGAVADVRVIDASPPGIFESQAVAEVRRRTYVPDRVDGVAVPTRRLEIVDFTLAPASEARDGYE